MSESLRAAITTHLAICDSARGVYSATAALEAVLDASDDLRKAMEEAAPDMGGTYLDLSDADDARVVRAALGSAIEAARDGRFEVAGVPVDVAQLVRLRRSINAGVVRNCERRCGLERAEAFQALRAAEAVCDSDDSEQENTDLA